MNRRAFLLSGVAGALWHNVLPAWGQTPGRVYRLGSLFSAPHNAPHHLALREELRRAGFVEGQNLAIDGQGFGLSEAQFDEHATQLVHERVDVIMAGGDAAVQAAQGATSEIPILALTDDMVGKGFVRSLAKPGGNITGVTILASELDGKRQEILTETVPGQRRIAALADRNTSPAAHLRALEETARAQGIELKIYSVDRIDEIVPAIDAAHASSAQALNVLASALLFNHQTLILARVAQFRLPAIYQWPETANQGGLIGYGPSIVQLYRDVQSRMLVRLLRGDKPADLPIEQPTKFELVINLKTAKALGLTVPQSLLARADELIE